jgi:SAM-dependent methyltransferase
MADNQIKFTGENFIPEVSEKRLMDDHLERYKFAAPLVRGAKVLDIACGSGYGSQLLLDSGAKSVDGVDISEKMVLHAQDRYSDEGIHFHIGDIRNFRGDAPYDFITCFETIEHLTEYQEAIANLFSLLKPGGKLLISSPNRPITTPDAHSLADKPSNPFHTQEFTPPELQGLLERQGFTIQANGIYGQRFQRKIKFKLIRKLYRMWVRPESSSNPAVLPLSKLAPRYFLLVAVKPA